LNKNKIQDGGVKQSASFNVKMPLKAQCVCHSKESVGNLSNFAFFK